MVLDRLAKALGGSVVRREQTAPAALMTAGLFDGGLNWATASASSGCTIYVLRRKPFVRFCRRNPHLTIRLLSEVGGHLRRTSAFIDLITAGGTCQRPARVLLDLMDEGGSARFALPYSHAELGARLGTVRELIYRNLKLIESRGVLQFSGKEITERVAALSAVARVYSGAVRVFESQAAPPIPACFVVEALRKRADASAPAAGDPQCPTLS